eukprot:gene9423-4375_t
MHANRSTHFQSHAYPHLHPNGADLAPVCHYPINAAQRKPHAIADLPSVYVANIGPHVIADFAAIHVAHCKSYGIADLCSINISDCTSHVTSDPPPVSLADCATDHALYCKKRERQREGHAHLAIGASTYALLVASPGVSFVTVVKSVAAFVALRF